MAAVNALRSDALADVDHQRVLLVQQAEELSRRTLADAERLAGRIVRQVTLAAAALLVLAAVLALAVLRLGRTRPGATTPP